MQLSGFAAILAMCRLAMIVSAGFVLGGSLQVPALWPPDDYEAHWLMTSDNHIAGLDTVPQHVLLDR
jgi:hypothetical protein